MVRRNDYIESLEALREVFGSEADYIETQNFNKLHRLVIGIDQGSLEETIEEGDFDIDAVDVMGRTPLYWASTRGDSDKVKLLLKYGASPNAGLSVIIGVIHHLELAQESTDFTHANKFQIIELLINSGVNLNVKEVDGYSPLHAAARHANGQHVLTLLLEKGLDPSPHNCYGQTPLHDAIAHNHVGCAKILIRYGADLNKCWGPSQPAIFDAVCENHHESAELLLQSGAEVKWIDVQRGRLSILHWLAKYGDPQMWSLFEQVDFTAEDFEYTNDDGETPLQILTRERPDADEEMIARFRSILKPPQLSFIP